MNRLAWLAMAAALVPVTATAQAPEIRIRQLSADQVGSRLVVRYAFAKRHWRRAMADTMLHVSAKSRRSGATRLQQAVLKPTGQVEIRLPESAGRVRVTVWLTRTGTRDEPLPLRVGPVLARRVGLVVSWTPDRPPHAAGPVTPPLPTVPLAPAPPTVDPARPNWAGNRAVIRACGHSFDGDRNESACLDLAARAPFHPAGMIRACERAMDGDRNELKCLEIAVRAGHDRSMALAACDKAMTGDRNELKCLDAAITAGYEPSRAIAACDKAMEGDRNELRCIEAAATAPGDPTSTIEACDRSMTGDRSELECIERGTRRPR